MNNMKTTLVMLLILVLAIGVVNACTSTEVDEAEIEAKQKALQNEMERIHGEWSENQLELPPPLPALGIDTASLKIKTELTTDSQIPKF